MAHGVTIEDSDAEKKPKTVGDKIRTMDDEALAFWLAFKDFQIDTQRKKLLTGSFIPEELGTQLLAFKRIEWLSYLREEIDE